MARVGPRRRRGGSGGAAAAGGYGGWAGECASGPVMPVIVPVPGRGAERNAGTGARFPGADTQQSERVTEDLDPADEHRIASDNPQQAEFERDR